MDLTRQIQAAVKGPLTRLAGQVARIATDLGKVNAKTQRVVATITGPLLGTQDVTITWPQPWPDTFYGVYPQLLTGTAAIGNVHATVKAGTKTETEVVITVTTLASVSAIGVDVLGVRT